MFATQYGFVFLSVGTLLVPSIENFTDRQDLKGFLLGSISLSVRRSVKMAITIWSSHFVFCVRPKQASLATASV
jgi:hypothetical protein